MLGKSERLNLMSTIVHLVDLRQAALPSGPRILCGYPPSTTSQPNLLMERRGEEGDKEEAAIRRTGVWTSSL